MFVPSLVQHRSNFLVVFCSVSCVQLFLFSLSSPSDSFNFQFDSIAFFFYILDSFLSQQLLYYASSSPSLTNHLGFLSDVRFFFSFLAGILGADLISGSYGLQLADEPSGGADPRWNSRQLSSPRVCSLS